ncbi:pyrophosphatase PpaX [Thermincola ferriacetica]
MAYNCILFDLDGTLLNTNTLVLESFRYTFKKHLGREVSDEELYPYFGVPLVDIMKVFDPDQVEEMIHTYRTFNQEKHDELTTLFPGVRETLTELRKKGIKMAVVTSKIRKVALKGLRLFSLDRFFDALIAFEDTEAHKPNPAPINRAMEILNHPAKRKVLMVGDSPFDIQCAVNAGVGSAAVKWSVHGIETLRRYKPDLVLSEFRDLVKITTAKGD